MDVSGFSGAVMCARCFADCISNGNTGTYDFCIQLKAEQIRADAMVRAEEVRSRNQLELEKLMREDKEDSVSRSAFSDGDLQRIHKESGEDILTDYEEPRQRSRVRD